jgi:hypothetical protein
MTPELAHAERGSTPGVAGKGAGVAGRRTVGSYLGRGFDAAGLLSSMVGQRTLGSEALDEPDEAHALRIVPAPPSATTPATPRKSASRRERGETSCSVLCLWPTPFPSATEADRLQSECREGLSLQVSDARQAGDGPRT